MLARSTISTSASAHLDIAGMISGAGGAEGGKWGARKPPPLLKRENLPVSYTLSAAGGGFRLLRAARPPFSLRSEWGRGPGVQVCGRARARQGGRAAPRPAARAAAASGGGAAHPAQDRGLMCRLTVPRCFNSAHTNRPGVSSLVTESAQLDGGGGRGASRRQSGNALVPAACTLPAAAQSGGARAQAQTSPFPACCCL